MNHGLEILSHRGYWKTAAEKNTTTAFHRSFEMGFGTETDIRDCLGRLVISHDPPLTDALAADDFFDLYAAVEARPTLALNIKADGLQSLLRAALDRLDLQNYFVFDMAVPDALSFIQQGFRVFTRQSEWEPEPAFYSKAKGVWLDAFVDDWVDPETIARHVDAGKQVCIVSPELHRRDHRLMWERLVAMEWAALPGVMLCTDLPELAREFFHDAN